MGIVFVRASGRAKAYTRTSRYARGGVKGKLRRAHEVRGQNALQQTDNLYKLKRDSPRISRKLKGKYTRILKSLRHGY